jgi:hypothetical protein
MSANSIFVSLAHCVCHNPSALRNRQAEITDRPVRIATDVSLLRIDYVPTKSELLGVW